MVKDFSKYVLWFESFGPAKVAQKILEDRRIECSRNYNELGFSDKKTRKRAKSILTKQSIVAVEI